MQPGFTQLLGRQAGTGGGCIGPVSASGGVTLTTKDTAIQYGLVSEVSELAVQYTAHRSRNPPGQRSLSSLPISWPPGLSWNAEIQDNGEVN